MTCKDGRFNTGNPICSNKPQDLHDNAMIIDAFTNSDADFVEDRFGVERKTIAGIEKQADEQIQKVDDKLNGIDQEIADKIIAQGGVEIINDWEQASDENVFSAGFLSANIARILTEDTIVKVPSDFTSIQDAVNYGASHINNLSKTFKIIIEKNFIPETGVYLDGVDASFITILSEDDEVMLSDSFGKANAFISVVRSHAPTLGCKVNGNNGSAGMCYKIHENSTGKVLEGCGGSYFWQDGLSARYGSVVYAKGAIFTHNAINNNTSSNVHALGSLIYFDGGVATDSRYYGVQSTGGAIINFRGGDCSRAFRYGIRVRDQGAIDAEGAVANDCLIGLYSFMAGYSNFRLGVASSCFDYGVAIVRSSNAVISECTVQESKSVGVLIESSQVDSSGLVVSNSKGVGVEISNSKVSLVSANVSNSFGAGVSIRGASNVNANSLVSTGNSTSGVYSLGSAVTLENAKLNNNHTGLWADRCSVISALSLDATSNNNRGIYATGGSTVYIKNSKCRKIEGTDTGGLNADITCTEGSTVSAISSEGGCNIAFGTMTSNGIVFK